MSHQIDNYQFDNFINVHEPHDISIYKLKC